jgi:hypothetical protein
MIYFLQGPHHLERVEDKQIKANRAITRWVGKINKNVHENSDSGPQQQLKSNIVMSIPLHSKAVNSDKGINEVAD